MAIIEAQAWVWSGVATNTTSICLWHLVEHLAVVVIGLDLRRARRPGSSPATSRCRPCGCRRCRPARPGARSGDAHVGHPAPVRADNGRAQLRVRRSLGQKGRNPERMDSRRRTRDHRRLLQQLPPAKTRVHVRPPSLSALKLVLRNAPSGNVPGGTFRIVLTRRRRCKHSTALLFMRTTFYNSLHRKPVQEVVLCDPECRWRARPRR